MPRHAERLARRRRAEMTEALINAGLLFLVATAFTVAFILAVF